MAIDQSQFVGVDIGGNHVRVSHSGNQYHDGVMIAAGIGGKTSLIFRASNLSEHPEIILPRFAGELSRLKSFSVMRFHDHWILRVQLAMQIKPERVLSITLGPALEDDIRRLSAALEPHDIQVYREDQR